MNIEIPRSEAEDVTGPDADDITGLPALRTWRSVYGLVCVVFVAYVVLLTLLSKVFA